MISPEQRRDMADYLGKLMTMLQADPDGIGSRPCTMTEIGILLAWLHAILEYSTALLEKAEKMQGMLEAASTKAVAPGPVTDPWEGGGA